MASPPGLTESQLQWKYAHHASVNPSNFEARKRVIDAFLKDYTVLDERLPLYVHKPFFTELLHEWNVKHHGNEHKAILWQKVLANLPNQKGLARRPSRRRSTRDRNPRLPQAPPVVKKPIAKKKVTFKTIPAKQTSPAHQVSCGHVLNLLLQRYQAKAIPTLKQLEREARLLLREQELDLIQALSQQVLGSLMAHKRIVAKKRTSDASESERTDTEESGSEEAEESARTDTEESGSEAMEEKDEPEQTEQRKPSATTSLEAWFRRTLQLNLSKKQLTALADSVLPTYQEEDPQQLYDVVATHVNLLDHIRYASYPNLFALLQTHVLQTLKRAMIEFPEGRDRDKVAIAEIGKVFTTFQFTYAMAEEFLDSFTDAFPPTLKRLVLQRWRQHLK